MILKKFKTLLIGTSVATILLNFSTFLTATYVASNSVASNGIVNYATCAKLMH